MKTEVHFRKYIVQVRVVRLGRVYHEYMEIIASYAYYVEDLLRIAKMHEYVFTRDRGLMFKNN